MTITESELNHNPEANLVKSATETPERKRATEQLKLIGASAIVLSHSPGVGGSTLAEMLHEKIEGSILYDGGREIRKSQGYTSSHTEYMPREVGIDESIDEIQMKLMRNATPENPVIINSKLGIFIAKKLMHENPNLNILTVLVTCKQRTAAERMKKRKSQQLKERFDNLSEAVLNEKITDEEFDFLLDEVREASEKNTVENIIADTRRRNERDRIQFGDAHGILKGVDIHNPGAKIIVGYDMDQKTGKPKPRYEKLWGVKHSTSLLNIPQSFESLVDKLVSTGNVKRTRKPKSTQSHPEFETSEKDYKSKAIGWDRKPLELTDELEEVRQILELPPPENFNDFENLERALIEAYNIEESESESDTDHEEEKVEKEVGKGGDIFVSEKTEGIDAEKTGEKRVKKVKKNGTSRKTSGKKVKEPMSRRAPFDRHPNPHHPSRTKLKKKAN